jgi:hypothetical protein
VSWQTNFPSHSIEHMCRVISMLDIFIRWSVIGLHPRERKLPSTENEFADSSLSRSKDLLSTKDDIIMCQIVHCVSVCLSVCHFDIDVQSTFNTTWENQIHEFTLWFAMSSIIETKIQSYRRAHCRSLQMHVWKEEKLSID